MKAQSYLTGTSWLMRIDGASINVRQDGKPVGVPIILIHAFAGSLEQWDDVAQSIAADHWVIRMDLLGHGASDKPNSGYSMPEQADRVARIASALGAEEFFVVGQSGGGNVVVALLENPKHSTRVKGATVIGSPPNMSFVNLPAIANIYRVPLLGRLMWRITSRKMVADTMANLFAPDFSPTPSIVVDDFFKMTRHSYVQAKANLEDFAHATPLSQRITASDVPFLVVFGDQDQWIPSACTDEWQRASHATILLMHGIGHTPPLEDAAQTAQIITEFVGSCAGGS
jgi:pimeloyl-ACP methyl ester carboxylesterase